MTTRGFKEEQSRATATLIADALDNPRDEKNIAAVRHGLTSWRVPSRSIGNVTSFPLASSG